MLRIVVLFLAILASVQAADLQVARSESNLEKRSDRALEEGLSAVDRARQAYSDGHEDQFKSELDTVKEAADLSYDSLKSTGKSARRSPKHFKRADFGLRAILRKLDSLEQDVSIGQRSFIQSIRSHVSDLHDQILTAIMTKK